MLKHILKKMFVTLYPLFIAGFSPLPVQWASSPVPWPLPAPPDTCVPAVCTRALPGRRRGGPPSPASCPYEVCLSQPSAHLFPLLSSHCGLNNTESILSYFSTWNSKVEMTKISEFLNIANLLPFVCTSINFCFAGHKSHKSTAVYLFCRQPSSFLQVLKKHMVWRCWLECLEMTILQLKLKTESCL